MCGQSVVLQVSNFGSVKPLPMLDPPFSFVSNRCYSRSSLIITLLTINDTSRLPSDVISQIDFLLSRGYPSVAAMFYIHIYMSLDTISIL